MLVHFFSNPFGWKPIRRRHEVVSCLAVEILILRHALRDRLAQSLIIQ